MRCSLLLLALCLSALPVQAQDGAAFIEVGIVEIENPNQAPCPGFGLDGCDAFFGRTVWHNLNVTKDYYLSAGGGEGGIDRIGRYVEMAAPFTFEMRFTEACVEEGDCLGIYPFDASAPDRIASVPFELWHIGIVEPALVDENDPANDVRMIPFLNANGEILRNWADTFTGTDPWPEGPASPITDWVYWMMPDRPDGYDRFAAVAESVGGLGNTYPWDLPDDNTCDIDGDGTADEDCDEMPDDGDTQVDLDPVTGDPCENQGYYVDFCYRNFESGIPGTSSNFIYPIGRLVIADFARKGMTPPAGTTIRFYTEGGRPVAAEDPAQASALRLGTPFPNPLRGRATVPFTVEQPGPVRLTVQDVLGRAVAVLVERDLAAGPHRAALDSRAFASGTYLLVLEADGQRLTSAATVLR